MPPLPAQCERMIDFSVIPGDRVRYGHYDRDAKIGYYLPFQLQAIHDELGGLLLSKIDGVVNVPIWLVTVNLL